jgi:hypothetical protein
VGTTMKRKTYFWFNRDDVTCSTIKSIFDDWENLRYDDTGKSKIQVAFEMGCPPKELEKYIITIELKRVKK